MSQTQAPPRSVLESYGLEPKSIERLDAGLINRTFAARRTDGVACILQRVSSIFPPEINDDIDAVTTHLKTKGLTTPLLISTADGRRHLEVDGAAWRLLTRIEGETTEVVQSDLEAREAGRVLGEFHRALADFERPLRVIRPGVHDVERHLGALRALVGGAATHAAHSDVAALAESAFALAARLAPLPATPVRLVHGDPKISNVIFDHGRGICLVDLDTIARMPVALELGDAMRSWCNPAGEDSPAAGFSLSRFQASLEGFRRAAPDLLTAAEWQEVPNATLAIAVELAARFAADAINESYFAWDPTRFASASEHNLARAGAQLALARAIEQELPAVRELVVTRT